MAIIAVDESKILYIEPIPYESTSNDTDVIGNTGNIPVVRDIARYTRTYGSITIKLIDENNNVVTTGATVIYQETTSNGNTPQIEFLIAGSERVLHDNILLTDNSIGYKYQITFPVSPIPLGDTYTQPGKSNVTIQSVLPLNSESTPGANDGKVKIIATSSSGPIKYSLDNINFQDSEFFSGLSGGQHTAYVKDTIPNSFYSYIFNVPTINNLLISDPTVVLDNGNVSRWNAAYNPVVFTYQRRDFEVSNIYRNEISEKLTIAVNQDLVNLKSGNSIYVQAGLTNNQYVYKGVYKVLSVLQGTVELDAAYIKPDVIRGFINVDAARPYYKIQTEISYQGKDTGQTQTIVATHRPDKTGLVKADLSSFLQSLLQVKDESNFTYINFRDDNLSASYTIRYAESWEGRTPTYISIGNPYYVTYSAKQLGNMYGGNMADYVPFKNYLSSKQQAKWITDFAEPAYSKGYPFDISFIYSENLAGLNVYYEIVPLDINRSPLPDGVQTSYLLNEDSSFLLNQDGGKLVIARQPVSAKPIIQPIAQQIGLNRLLINSQFTEQVYYLNLTLKYNNTDGPQAITQTQTIRIDHTPDDQSVYLRWIGLTGSWNYFRFTYNQEVTLDVQNAVIVKNYVSDWAEQDTIEDVISKSAGIKMKVMAEDLSVADIKGLQSIKYSPKVQMLVSKNPVKWQTVVLNTATFSEYETRNGQAPFSVTFNLPAMNIQTQ